MLNIGDDKRRHLLAQFGINVNLEKAGGEGSKGGKVIGHTKSGKPIYANKKANEYKEFSAEDHRDANYYHQENAKSPTGKFSQSKKGNHHLDMANEHFLESRRKDRNHMEKTGKAHDNLSEIEKAKLTEKKKSDGKEYRFMKDGKYAYDYNNMTPSDHEEAMSHHKDEWFKMKGKKKKDEKDEDPNIQRHKREYNLHATLAEKKNEQFDELEKADDKGKKKIAKVMRGFENGTLKSSSGEVVTDKKQALAIAMSEAGLSKGVKSGKELDELIDEHKQLVGLLESPSHKDDKREAKKQKTELEEYEKEKELKKAYGVLGLEYEIEDTMEKAKKGEGSKGGHVIGHTKSGKPIYQSHSASHKHYKDFSSKDHLDAAMSHQKEAGKYKIGDKDSVDLAKEKIKQFSHHDKMANDHFVAGTKKIAGEKLDEEVESGAIEKPTHSLKNIPVSHDEYKHHEGYKHIRSFVDKHALHADLSDPSGENVHFHGNEDSLKLLSHIFGGSDADVTPIKTNGGTTKEVKKKK